MVSALEFHCCRGIPLVNQKLTFDGRIMRHNNFSPRSHQAVSLQVAPFLKGTDQGEPQQAESAVTIGRPCCVAGTQASRREVHSSQQLFGSGRDASLLCHNLF